MKKERLVKKLASLKKYADKEKEPRYCDRLRALISVGEGNDPKDVAKVFNVHWHTIKYRWIKDWNKGGYCALIDKPKSGRTPKLGTKERKALRQYVLGKDKRITCKELSKFVKERWNINCDEETIRKILISMKLSWQKPDKENYKADPVRRKIFLKGAQEYQGRSWK